MSDPIENECLTCGSRLDATSHTGGEDIRPSEGDVSICFYCAAVMIFTGNKLERRHPTAEEAVEIMADEEVAQTVLAVRRLRNIA